MVKVLDIIGKKFNKALVAKRLPNNKNGKSVFECICDCGNVFSVLGSSLTSGNTKSCGCFKIETTKRIMTKHNMSKSAEHSCWRDMKRRCFNKNNKHFKDYHDRGISVHTDFINSFEKWFKEVGSKPDDGRRWSIGRIDNNGWYTYGNMRWELDVQQARNHSRQINNTSGITGVYFRSDRKIWVVQWNDISGKKKQKEFPISIYGEKARQSAINYRINIIKELNLQGADYQESHGKEK